MNPEPKLLDFSRIKELQELVSQCHPTKKPKPDVWYFANPTLVLDSDSGYVGYTAFSIGYGSGTVMHLMDTGIRADYRGKGLAKQLMLARLDIARALEITLAIGATTPDNVPMKRLLEDLGFHACQRVSKYYHDEDPPRDGIIYSVTLNIGE